MRAMLEGKEVTIQAFIGDIKGPRAVYTTPIGEFGHAPIEKFRLPDAIIPDSISKEGKKKK